MKILFDECVPWPIHKVLGMHECHSVQRCGWTGVKNGKLLTLAEAKFDLLITSDGSMRYQQNLQNRPIAILQLSTNKLNRILQAADELRRSVASVRPGQYRHLQIP